MIILVMADTKVVDDSFTLSPKRGNGVLRREVWVDKAGKVIRYNLAYVHHGICQRDNGRVVGYDNAHGLHHRHYMGKVEPVAFVSFEDIEARFEEDWTKFRRKK